MPLYTVAVKATFTIPDVEVEAETEEQAFNRAKAKIGVLNAAEAAALAPEARVRSSGSREFVERVTSETMETV